VPRAARADDREHPPRRALGALSLLPGLATAQGAPRRGGSISVAQCSANRFVASAQTARHPYFTVDLTTRIPYNALVWVDRQMRLQPELAIAWQPASADQSVWDITLRPGVRFHDGTALRAEDVVASYELHRQRNFASGQIQKIEAMADGRVRFTLDAGNSEFPYVLVEYQNMIMPAAPIEIASDSLTTSDSPACRIVAVMLLTVVVTSTEFCAVTESRFATTCGGRRFKVIPPPAVFRVTSPVPLPASIAPEPVMLPPPTFRAIGDPVVVTPERFIERSPA
jgi:hypothetical protein